MTEQTARGMLWTFVQVEGMSLVIDDLVGSTGLELKVDPGVPYVYAGFAGMPKHRHPVCPFLLTQISCPTVVHSSCVLHLSYS